MLAITGTLLGALAVIAVALEAPSVAFVVGGQECGSSRTHLDGFAQFSNGSPLAVWDPF